ncbi:MAG: altronate dehydratase, partial [Parabacteroides sp.]|nr:altronate dehydratase [Parabacteroides sp.]
MKRFLKINEVDNVAVAISDDLKKGEVITFDGRPITLHEDIQSGHKFAIKEI